ncbi:HAD family hydrolase [Streptomyces meridianus]|uniref:HAD-IA family hydrolase n=1 Tax=Streptomyces meridianus TaxID=2938945 RepID=A0ABT0X461_9ACTN|nr:HAD-IA family hydrolase [Streptomyces meridianus]MCM2577318.1 HAD-IA family hydrolase [Streptomyces meridianus]
MISVLDPADEPGNGSIAVTAVFAHLLGNVRDVLFDFDGPLCDLFAGNHRLARRRTVRMTRQIRALLIAHGQQPPCLRRRNDPHELFRSALDAIGTRRPALATALRTLLERQEVDAAEKTAVPTPGAHDLVVWLSENGVGLAVASNNAQAAVEAHLHRTELVDRFRPSVVGRPADHRLMKPDPHCIHLAMKRIQADHDSCLMIGDSLADVAAARAAGIRICAYSPKRSKRRRLLAAGASFAVGSIQALHEALHATRQLTAPTASHCTYRSH